MTFRCEQCGEVHEGLQELSFQRPDEVWQMSPRERQRRSRESGDRCVLDGPTKKDPKRHFLRGLIVVPVRNADDTWAIGCWVEVAEADYAYYHAHYKDDNSAVPRFPGRLANVIDAFELPLGTPLQVQLGDTTRQPSLWFAAKDEFELAQLQRDGISMARLHELLD